MNEYDSNRIYDLTSTIDFKKTDIKKEADCFVLNTCHIREKATEKVYDEIGRVKKDFKNLKKPLNLVNMHQLKIVFAQLRLTMTRYMKLNSMESRLINFPLRIQI